jgi:hypothetical protein
MAVRPCQALPRWSGSSSWERRRLAGSVLRWTRTSENRAGETPALPGLESKTHRGLLIGGSLRIAGQAKATASNRGRLQANGRFSPRNYWEINARRLRFVAAPPAQWHPAVRAGAAALLKESCIASGKNSLCHWAGCVLTGPRYRSSQSNVSLYTSCR